MSLELPWDYQLVNGKCEMVSRLDHKSLPFISKTQSYPLSYTNDDIKDEFIKEFLTPNPILSSEFVKSSQKFIKRDVDIDLLFEIQLSPLAVDFAFKKDSNGLKFNEYEEVR